MDPLSDANLHNLVRIRDTEEFRVISRESTHTEFKESYSHSGMASYFKTMAAFANNSGGYIIFGVSDNPRIAKGLRDTSLSQFEGLRVEEFTSNLNDYFDPEIVWSHRTFEQFGRSFGAIYVFRLNNRPCISKKTLNPNDENSALREGDIFYRYGGRSQRIRFAELRDIQEATRQYERDLWVNLIRNAMTIGVENASLLDLSSGRIGGQNGSIILEERLLDRLRFIESGHFSEDAGAPTLRLIGNIEEIRSAGAMLESPQYTEVRSIETQDVVSHFLAGSVVVNPMDYIKRVCSESSANYPIHYYCHLSGLTPTQIVAELSTYRTTAVAKATVLRRISGERIPQVLIGRSDHPASTRRRNRRDQLLQQHTLGPIEDRDSLKDAMCVVEELTDEEIRFHAAELREVFLPGYFDWIEDGNGNHKSQLRRTIARIDQALFADSYL